jgi:Complex I intermediate-associated protein 30 (CIA30)
MSNCSFLGCVKNQLANQMYLNHHPFFRLLLLIIAVESFQSIETHTNLIRDRSCLYATENKAMSFLRRKGVVGGSKDFTNALGIDEGPTGKNGPAGKHMRKSSHAYVSCAESGVIDDFSEEFPLTSCGTEWSGFSDRVMGGVSIGSLVRENISDRECNVLRGEVSLQNNGGFIQMAAELSNDPSKTKFVDASRYDGIEVDVLCKGDKKTESFNIQ